MQSSCACQFSFTGRAVAGSLRQSACPGSSESMLTACTYVSASTSRERELLETESAELAWGEVSQPT